jgi:hypothetical protein
MCSREQAEKVYADALRQIEKWGRFPDSVFARNQVDMWRRIAKANEWCLPGGSNVGRATKGEGDAV